MHRGFCEENEEEEEEEEEALLASNTTYKSLLVDFNEDVSLVASLKACAKQKDLHRGHRIHVEVVQRGLLDINTFVGNSLVNLYAKCGLFAKARGVFDEIFAQNVVSWNALIAGYAQYGHVEFALYCFEQMQLEGILPNRVTFLSTLKACASAGTAGQGQKLHAEIIKLGFLAESIIFANTLIDMYAKCGLGGKAQELFDNLLVRDVVTWNSLINIHAQEERGEEVLNYFALMQHQGVCPDTITFVCVLKACCNLEASCKGQEIHARIAYQGLPEKNNVVATTLIDMYGKHGLHVKAQEVFDKLMTPVVVSWNALIAGYVQHEHFDKALNCFRQMKVDGFLPDGVTLLCILKACGMVQAGNMGLEIHSEIAREGLWEEDTVIANALIDMYAKCDLVNNAQEVFDKLVSRNTVSWNSLIAGYVQGKHGEKALSCFEQMQHEGFLPDIVTFICILKACGNVKAAHKGQEIHANIAKLGVLEEETVVFNALIDLYANCGMLAEAQDVFSKILVQDVASWNTLIVGLAQQNHGEEALQFFECMQTSGFLPNSITFLSALKVCDTITAVYKGQGIHSEIVKRGLLESDMVIGTALVGMYANCGMLAEAQELFDKLPTRDLVLWNVLLAGYAQLGLAEIAFNALEKMIKEGVLLDIASCTIILNACIHTGLVDKGQIYFELMRTGYGIFPVLEHHNCMVDLFARAGQLDRAVAMIEEMPFSASERVWHILLGASQRCRDINLGKIAFAHAAELNEVDTASYVFLSNMLAAAHNRKDAGNEGEDANIKKALTLSVD